MRLKSGDIEHGGADFVVARSAHPQPYLVSVRPLLAARASAPGVARGGNRFCARSARRRNGGDRVSLRELFGLTEAEAALAQALDLA